MGLEHFGHLTPIIIIFINQIINTIIYNFSFLPTSRGFESFYGLYNGKGDYFSHLDTELGMTGLDWHLDEGPNRTDLHSELGEYATRAFATRADQLISEHDFERQPMFLYMALTAPHSALPHDPLQVPFQTEQQVTVGKNAE